MERYRHRLAQDTLAEVHDIRIAPGGPGVMVKITCRRSFLPVAFSMLEAQLVMSVPSVKVVKGRLEIPGPLLPLGKRMLHISSFSRLRTHQYRFVPADAAALGREDIATAIVIIIDGTSWTFPMSSA